MRGRPSAPQSLMRHVAQLDRGILWIRLDGVPAVDPLLNAIESVQAQYPLALAGPRIWDVRDLADHMDFTDVRALVGEITARSTVSPPEGRSAVLVGSAISYGVARQVSAMLPEEYSSDLRIFSDEDEAVAYVSGVAESSGAG